MSERERSVESSGNVFEDVGFDKAEAAMLLVRARLMLALSRHLRSIGKTQVELAPILGIGQSRVSDLMKGKAKLFSLDMLLLLAQRLGMEVSVAVQSAGAVGSQRRARPGAEQGFHRLVNPTATSREIHGTPRGTATAVIVRAPLEDVGVGVAHIHASGTVVAAPRYRFAQARTTEGFPPALRVAA